jgi:hypothetical protein
MLAPDAACEPGPRGVPPDLGESDYRKPTPSPSPLLHSPPKRAAVAQLARASACHAEGREFESLQPLTRKPCKSRGFRRCGGRVGGVCLPGLSPTRCLG